MAKYNLEDVKALAQQNKIRYNGRKVLRDISNLGYERKDVVDCLSQLSNANFHQTHQYANRPAFDAYVCKFMRRTQKGEPKAELDNLYIKFFLSDGYLNIELASFHLSS